jgi:TRAP-type C4-dicarboxylate transport system substrate-binding protein
MSENPLTLSSAVRRVSKGRRRVLRYAIALGAIALSTSGSCFAEPVQLKFAFIGPASGHMHQGGMGKFAEAVNKDAAGEVEIKVFNGPVLGTLGNIYDRLLNGVVEIAYGTMGPIITQFPKSSVSMLPFETHNAREGSLALWGALARGVIADEFMRVKPLATVGFANVSFHSRKPIARLEDVKGLKISAQSRLMGQVVEAFGGTAISMPVNDMYPALQRGTVDAAATAWPAVQAFKIIEVVNTHIEEPLGGEGAFVSMNADVYAKLPAKARAAIDRYAGPTFSEWLGVAIDTSEEEGRTIGRHMADHRLVKLDPAEVARWKRQVQPVVDEWIKATPNGAAVLATYREEIAKNRSTTTKK